VFRRFPAALRWRKSRLKAELQTFQNTLKLLLTCLSQSAVSEHCAAAIYFSRKREIRAGVFVEAVKVNFIAE
ncbi:MAG: hypothetical protein LH472_02845, partial [Pyrinomonadaceae bacterium]|nr:hypothetical protein [Pyrinomonadaceae bacterium]